MWNLLLQKQAHSYNNWSPYGLPEPFLIPDKSADTMVFTFINQYLPVHMCPRYILSDNGMEFRNLMDQVLKQLGIERIFSTPCHLQSNRKLEVFHKYMKPTLKKLYWKDLSNWDKYINQVHASYRVTPNPCHSRNPIFPSLWKRSQFTHASAFRIHAMIFGRSRLWNAQSWSSQTSLSHC